MFTQIVSEILPSLGELFGSLVAVAQMPFQDFLNIFLLGGESVLDELVCYNLFTGESFTFFREELVINVVADFFGFLGKPFVWYNNLITDGFCRLIGVSSATLPTWVAMLSFSVLSMPALAILRWLVSFLWDMLPIL